MKTKLIPFFCVCLLGLSLHHCKSDRRSESDFTLRLRIKDEPDCLNPIVSQTSIATQIEAMVMLPLIEYDMRTLELSPVMVENLSRPEIENDTAQRYSYRIREEARWDDGRPVTAADVAFTVKAALNPYVKNPSWRSSLQNILDIQGQGKEVTVRVARNYLLSDEVSGNFNVYPAHVYDPNNLMKDFGIGVLRKMDTSAFTAAQKRTLAAFAEIFQSDSVCRKGICGAGPYALKRWEAASKVVLEKKKNWWARDLADSLGLLSQYPDRIEYLVIPEEASAIAALKEGSLDLVSDLSQKSFMSLQKDSNYANRLQFITVQGFGYTAIDVNTRRPGLNDRQVRLALASLLDVDSYIENIAYGLASRINSPIHPSRAYYHKSLPPVAYNPAFARQVLEAAGWKDRDGDGILDKKTEEGQVALNFRILVAGDFGQKIALIFQDEAKKIGVQIKPEKKEMGQFMKDINERNFDLVITNISQSPSPYDPFQSWHSSNAKPGGSNRCGISMTALDQAIDWIRLDPQRRMEGYLKFQEILHREKVQWFLFSPHTRLVASSKIIVEPSIRRPGYFENTIRLKK